MASWSGRRKALVVLLFVSPTILGLMIFNVFPIIFNTYISFTNRNQFRPNPDCEQTIAKILEPACWPAFKDTAPRGAGQPYRVQDPLFRNYSDLIGGMFTREGLGALARFAIVFLPLVAASQINKRFDRLLSRPVPSIGVWMGGLVGSGLVGWGIDLPGAASVLEQSGPFFIVFFRTVLFVVLSIPINYALGLALALVLNNNYIKGRTFFRAVMIIPWAASTMFIIMALIWQFFFRDRGVINQILALFDFRGPTWLNDPIYAFAIILLVNLWFSFPFAFNVILGCMQSIPEDMYEAADVDGASGWQQLINITLPMIRPSVLPAVVLSAIGAGGFQMFGTVWAITQGGPTRGAGAPGATELVMIYAYKQVFQFSAFAKAGAFAVIVFGLLFAATIYSLRLTRITKGAFE
jgi:arabinogalactan oligomer / maltooligosaccharide transport system permease protein